MRTIGYAAPSPDEPLRPFVFDRRELRPDDVALEILHCGVCHSDLHVARNDWHRTIYPVVPGHEIVGRVTAVGSQVSGHKVGDYVAVGCMVDSCQACDQCNKGQEQFCRRGNTQTYNSLDTETSTPTRGGYSKCMVVGQRFVIKIPAALDPDKAAPLLCAGITVYSSFRTWKVASGSRVGIIGLGGLGHIAVKLATAMGADVTVISRTGDKAADALALGAHRFLVSTDARAIRKAGNAFDFILDTIPVAHDLSLYLPLLDIDGTLVVVGQIGTLGELNSTPLLLGRRRVAGSPIGGIAETQEMLEFCAQRNILPEVEMIRMDEVNDAFARMQSGEVRYRFVIDMSSLVD